MNYLQMKKKALLNSVRKKETEYIKSGLIAMYDGMNNTRIGHNSNPDKWEDLSGNGNDLTLQGVTFSSNKAILKGSVGQIAYCDNAIEPVVTAEIVVKKININNHRFIAEFNKSAKKVFGFDYYSKGLTISNPYNKVFLFDIYKINALSVNYKNQSVCCNGKAVDTSNDSRYWGYRAAHNIQLVKYNDSTGQYNLEGEIYSIRLYNRELTDEERLHNYKIDNERFLNGGN